MTPEKDLQKKPTTEENSPKSSAANSESIDKSPNKIPGLSKSQQKKAQKRARKIRAEQSNNENDKYPKSKLNFLKKDLVKCGLELSDMDDEFEFGDISEDEFNGKSSKFFRKPPSDPPQSQKRVYSPENIEDLRKLRQKQK